MTRYAVLKSTVIGGFVSVAFVIGYDVIDGVKKNDMQHNVMLSHA